MEGPHKLNKFCKLSYCDVLRAEYTQSWCEEHGSSVFQQGVRKDSVSFLTREDSRGTAKTSCRMWGEIL